MRTIVSVQIPFSTSHVLTVESKPQLYAVFPFVANTALETRAVWDLSTVTGAFLLGRSASSTTFRRFFRSWTTGSGTSSVEGICVSQSPIRPSHEAVRRCDPDRLDETEETGPVCRWRDARALVVILESEGMEN